GARALARVLRADALPHRLDRGRLRSAGPAPLLRLLRGDADPAVRARRRLGRSAARHGDAAVRHLHSRGLDADAGLDRRLRHLAGHVQPRRLGDELERLDLPGLRGRVRGQVAARPLPRLAAHRLHVSLARGVGHPLGRRLQGRRLRLRPHLPAEVPGAGGRLPHHHPGARRGRPRVRLAPRLPPARPARRRRLLLARPDEPDRARHLRLVADGSRRRGAALRQPRARVGGDVPVRRLRRAQLRQRRVRAARRGRQGTAAAGDDPDDRGHVHARRARLLELRRRVPHPRRCVPTGLGLLGRGRGRDRARRDVHAAADLGRAARAARGGGARRRRGARPAGRPAVHRRAAARLPARALRVAERRQRARLPAAVRERGLERVPAARGAGAVIAAIPTPHVDWLALSPALALLGASGAALLGAVLVPSWLRRPFAAASAGAGFVLAGVLAGVVFARSAEATTLIADSMTRDRWAALAQVVVAGAGAVAVLVAWGDGRREHIGEYHALLAAAGGGMVFFVQAGNLMTLFLGLEWFSIALYVLCALDTERERSLEAGLKYLIIG